MSAPELHFPSRAALRRWLVANHADHGPIWLVYDKKPVDGSAHALTYDDIVEEALCFGWIDSVAGRVDERRAKLYFSPRKPRSVWSALNKRRVAKLEADGLMTPAGRVKIDAAKIDGSWTALDAAESLTVPPDLGRALRARRGAKKHFDAFPPGVRKQILTWVYGAKRPETRARRVDTVAELAQANLRAVGPGVARRAPGAKRADR